MGQETTKTESQQIIELLQANNKKLDTLINLTLYGISKNRDYEFQGNDLKDSIKFLCKGFYYHEEDIDQIALMEKRNHDKAKND